MSHTPPAVPAFTNWPSFPFEGEFRVKKLEDPVAVEPPRKGEGTAECISCNAPDDAYIWVSERWRVRAMDRPSGLPVVLILESRSHLDLGDLPNLLAAELGVMTVRLERAVRSLDGVARVHVNRWGDGSAHLHMWFLARPYGRLQLRGTFLSLWDDILPPIPESQWRENLALVAAWLAEFGGRPLAEPPRIQWQAPSSLTQQEAQLTQQAVPTAYPATEALGDRSGGEVAPLIPDGAADENGPSATENDAGGAFGATIESTASSTLAQHPERRPFDVKPTGAASTSTAPVDTAPTDTGSTDTGSTGGESTGSFADPPAGAGGAPTVVASDAAVSKRVDVPMSGTPVSTVASTRAVLPPDPSATPSGVAAVNRETGGRPPSVPQLPAPPPVVGAE